MDLNKEWKFVLMLNTPFHSYLHHRRDKYMYYVFLNMELKREKI